MTAQHSIMVVEAPRLIDALAPALTLCRRDGCCTPSRDLGSLGSENGESAFAYVSRFRDVWQQERGWHALAIPVGLMW